MYQISEIKLNNIGEEIFHIFENNPKVIPLYDRIKNNAGRLKGRIIASCRSHLNKTIYQFIDFKRRIFPRQKSLFLRHRYENNRSASICLVCYPIGTFLYILGPNKIKKDSFVTNMIELPYYYGDSSSLEKFPTGVLIHNIHGKYIRSAGCSAILVRKDNDQTLLKLKSGELRYFNSSVIASSGSIDNHNHFLINYKKAGLKRHLGRRPRVRPSAMNPVDHTMGGRTKGGMQPKNRKGVITLNRPTAHKKHSSRLRTKRQLKLLRQ